MKKSKTIRTQDLLYGINVVALNIVALVGLSIILDKHGSQFESLVPCMIISLVVIVLELMALFRVCEKQFNYFIIFVISFIIFHFGCFIVYAFGYKADYYYLLKYEPSTVLNTLKYQIVC